MVVQVTIPHFIEDLDTLILRLEKYYGVSAFLTDDKLQLSGPSENLNAAQVYALRFVGPETILILHILPDCLRMFLTPSLLHHFEVTHRVVILTKASHTLILKGGKIDSTYFGQIIRNLESTSKSSCGVLSSLKQSTLRDLCFEFGVQFDDLRCSDSVKLALLTYFSFLPECSGQPKSAITNGSSTDAPFIEVYRKKEQARSASADQVVPKSASRSRSRKNKSNSGSSTVGESSSSSSSTASNPALLRPIVIDGTNVAFAHGNQREFSPVGIRLALEYFIKRGHTDVVVVIPRHWQAVGGRYFEELEHSGLIAYTPSRYINKQRRAAYDDRVILQLAANKNAAVISNDQYRDLINEKSEFKELIETRLLQFVISGDTFLIPEDPYGPTGPSLTECLSLPNPIKG